MEKLPQTPYGNSRFHWPNDQVLYQYLQADSEEIYVAKYYDDDLIARLVGPIPEDSVFHDPMDAFEGFAGSGEFFENTCGHLRLSPVRDLSVYQSQFKDPMGPDLREALRSMTDAVNQKPEDE